jgi:hypothetical protein
MASCAQCGRQAGGLGSSKVELVTIGTGGRVCRRCQDEFLRAAAGIVAAGPRASTSTKVGAAVSTAGWLSRIRAARRRGRGTGVN